MDEAFVSSNIDVLLASDNHNLHVIEYPLLLVSLAVTN